MIILGIDPGISSIGYALVISDVQNPKVLKMGLFRIQKKDSAGRLKEIHTEMSQLIKKWRPSAVAVEKLFFAKNQKTAMAVAEARGIILLTTALANLNVCEYTPLEVKKTVTGDGRADKLQLKKMLALTVPKTIQFKFQDDMFDALAVALTCFYKERLNNRSS